MAVDRMEDEKDRRMQLLEEKFAFQEKTIDALNEVVIDQQAQLELLKEQLRELREIFRTVQHPPYPSSGDGDPPPPHY